MSTAFDCIVQRSLGQPWCSVYEKNIRSQRLESLKIDFDRVFDFKIDDRDKQEENDRESFNNNNNNSDRDRNCLRNPLPIWSMDMESTDERYLLVGRGDGSIALFDLDESDTKKLYRAIVENNRRNNPRSYVFDNEDDVEYSNIAKPIALINKQRKDATSRVNNNFYGYDDTEQRFPNGHAYAVTSVQWYPVDTGIFVTASLDGTIKLWDTNTLEVVSQYAHKDQAVYSMKMPLRFSGHSLIAAGLKKALVLCDMTSGASSHHLLGHKGQVNSVSWRPNEEYQIVSGGEDQTLRLWDIRKSGSTACLKSFSFDEQIPSTLKRKKISPNMFSTGINVAHNRAITATAFTLDGGFLLSRGRDNQMKLWKVSTGECMYINYIGMKDSRAFGVSMTIVQEGFLESAMVFSPNEDGNILVHDVHSNNGEIKKILSGHQKRCNICIYRKSTQEILSGSHDGMILVWSPKSIEIDPHNLESLEEEEEEEEKKDNWSGEEDQRIDSLSPYIPPILWQI